MSRTVTEKINEIKHNPVKIFVGNLPFSTTKTDLEELFSKFGAIIGVNVREDRATGKPKGFAFITFDSEISAVSAIEQMNGFTYQGRPLTVSNANTRGSETTKDNDKSWKTVPTPSPSERATIKKEKLNGKDKKKENSKRKATWDEWAGPARTLK